MITTGSAALFAIVFMAAGVFLTVMFFVAAALVVVGHFKPSRRMQRAGWIVLAIWFLPAVPWTYYLQVLTEQDQYRILSKPEVVYGVPLPAGAQINFRRWARRLQAATLPAPQTIQGVEYILQVNFCGKRVCSGTLARDQEIGGLPCLAQTAAGYSETTGRLIECTLAHPFSRQGVTWPMGTEVRINPDTGDSYLPPAGAAPIQVAGLAIHSGLIVSLTTGWQIRNLDRNQSQLTPDTLLEVGDIILISDHFHFERDGTIRGGILARAAVLDGKPMHAGDPVVIPNKPGR